MGAYTFLKVVDFRAFAVNVKTIAPTQKLYQSGHAIWNADLPMQLYTFLEEYDFSGKTTIPFTTHGGSGFFRTIQTISELQPNGPGVTGSAQPAKTVLIKVKTVLKQNRKAML